MCSLILKGLVAFVSFVVFVKMSERFNKEFEKWFDKWWTKDWDEDDKK